MALRAWLGPRVALVQQDVLRRIVLREPDVFGGVILEGIMSARRYGDEEQIIDEKSCLDDTVNRILRDVRPDKHWLNETC